MTSVIESPSALQVPASSDKKARACKKKTRKAAIFGMLPDWEIDTQAHKDELRDS